jgi:hypothetical protein
LSGQLKAAVTLPGPAIAHGTTFASDEDEGWLASALATGE